MPVYDYYCAVCGHTFEDYFRIAATIPDIQECPECKQLTAKWQFPCPHTHKDFTQPLKMFSLASAKPDEVEAFRRANPDIQCSGDKNSDEWGVPIVHNAQERDRVLKHFHYCMKEKKR